MGGVGAFATAAMSLLRAGYSPVPIREGLKRPLIGGWQKLRSTPLSEFEIWHFVRRHPLLGLGVAGGYRGLVPIDIDTDDPEIFAAVTGVLPKPLVAKAGKRGVTAFYRSAKPIAAKKFKTPWPKDAMLVEILATGQTVLPPTIHPDTKLPYRWLTLKTLFDTPVDKLQEIMPDTIVALESTMARWLPRQHRRTWMHTKDVEESCPSASDPRMRSYARAVLAREARQLQEKPKDSGRNWKLFVAACKLGRFVHHNVLAVGEVESALLSACRANGLVKDDGLRACEATLASGLRKSQNDALPNLLQRKTGLTLE